MALGWFFLCSALCHWPPLPREAGAEGGRGWLPACGLCHSWGPDRPGGWALEGGLGEIRPWAPPGGQDSPAVGCPDRQAPYKQAMERNPSCLPPRMVHSPALCKARCLSFKEGLGEELLLWLTGVSGILGVLGRSSTHTEQWVKDSALLQPWLRSRLRPDLILGPRPPFATGRPKWGAGGRY